MNKKFIAFLHQGEYQYNEDGSAVMGVFEGGYSIEFQPLEDLEPTTVVDIFNVKQAVK